MDTIIAIEATFTASEIQQRLRISHFLYQRFNNATNTNEGKNIASVEMSALIFH
jgi:hypothetical protein